MSECKCELQMQQNESLHVAIGLNGNVLSDKKSTHTQCHRRVAYAPRRENYTGTLIAFIVHIRTTHKWNLSSRRYSFTSYRAPSLRLNLPYMIE